MRRVAPAILLFFLAPLVSEFLLGNLPITMLPALLVLAPMYGGGALLIREAVRRTKRGWPTIFVLALTYGIVEEAFTTQTLFNPNYLGLGLHLLETAYIPSLGISGWWTAFVLTLHTVWSIPVSIALSEALVPERAATPWLGRAGLAVTGVVFALGALVQTLLSFQHDHFMASAPQLAGAALLSVILVVAAFLLQPAQSNRSSGRAPNAWLVGIVALVASSAFLLTPREWGWGAVGVYLALDLGVIAAVTLWSRRADWGSAHRLALAGGAALTYAWHSFFQRPVFGAGHVVDLAANVVFALGAVVLLAIAARRTVPAACAAVPRSQ